MSNLETVKSYTVPKTTVIIDLDQSENYYPTLGCVAAGTAEANDAFTIESTNVGTEKAFMFHFKSEVGGAIGLFGDDGGFSKYGILLTEGGKVFASKLTESGAPDLNIKFQLKDPDRVSLLLAQALGCYAYSMAENGYYSTFESFITLAKNLDSDRNQLKPPEGAANFGGYQHPCGSDILCYFTEGMSSSQTGW